MKTFPLYTRLSALVVLLTSVASHAYDCTGVPSYPPLPGQSISAGDVYQHQNIAYECQVTGWCGIADWAYAPGTGMYWQQAWTELGMCETVANQAPQISDVHIVDPSSGDVFTYPQTPVLQANKDYRISANFSDPDANLMSWEIILYENSSGVLSNPQFLLSESTPGIDAVEIETSLFTIANSQNYTLQFVAVDNALETTSLSFDFSVSAAPQATLTVSSSHAVYLGEFSATNVRAWHPSVMPSRPSIQFEAGAIADLHVGNSTSSGGPSIGYDYQLNYSWRAAKLGPMTIAATLDEQSISTVVEVLPVDGLPLIRIDAAQNAQVDMLVVVEATALDKDALNQFQLSMDGSILNPIETTNRIANETIWGQDLKFEFTMPSTNVVLVAEAIDADGNIQVLEHVIELQSQSGDCTDLGISVENINEYPNWPRLDWQGLPSHALGGDFLIYEGKVYKALWWTQSLPGSNSSWQYVCEI